MTSTVTERRTRIKTDSRKGRLPKEIISDRVLSVWGLTPAGRVEVGRIQPTPVEKEGYVEGAKVVIVTPDNLKLHNSYATILIVEPWGCHLEAPAAESGRFRALWSEMVLAK